MCTYWETYLENSPRSKKKINEPLAKANGKQGCHTRCIYNIKEILIFIQMERSRLLTWRCINSYPVSSKLMTG
ncbi:hypothetical protein P4493_25125 [Bacillus thuringiensis]|uniref:Uncharacterized protein n=8 Tax=Bacillus cereus group TaxID=86661 RepID=A0A9Q7N8C7_BACTU|nr:MULTISPECIES: hypothetical protein [Bacillus]MED1158320.1 hypothetical protein [Bacillus paranthracis]OUA90877.1 hypothetical protein BK706_12385 [Bacillus thuringiensis serovar leesis]AFQ14574.1 hypothetical protein BTG_05405 [Bacillus thuringiensis HD-771]AFQ26494.1 hypothetical protein BTF1_11495 [Bacillus thuringiensis HD-789]AJH08513.1 hypothetical protein AS86_1199 [Bacillus thuringiensis HD1002]